MAVYIVTGTPGVGKTTVLNEAIKGRNLKVVVFGDTMFEIAKEMGLVRSKDEMRTKIKLETYKQIQEKAAEKIAKMGGDIIVDTHAAIKRVDGYYPGLPERVLKRLNPKAIVVIEARPSDIELRRKDDLSRMRTDFGGADQVIEYQNINRAFVAAYSALTGCLFKIIVNEQGRILEAAEKLREVFK
jgi:adenylate kinase